MAKEEKVEVKELTFQEKLEKQIQGLEKELKQTELHYNQIVGALNTTKGMLEEYKKHKE